MMKIDGDRLQRSIDERERIGETPRGGLTRLALSDEDRRGRDWMVGRMREAGLRVAIDQVGNIFGERAGAEALSPVVMGSHVDSVPTGGDHRERRQHALPRRPRSCRSRLNTREQKPVR
jgi:N-carbamoyl-L-amino-acid hydrolase